MNRFLPAVLNHINYAIQTSKYIPTLPADWDEDGAYPIEPEIWETAVNWLMNYSEYIYKNFFIVIAEPDINPVRGGSVDLSWHIDDYSLLVNVRREEGRIVAGFFGCWSRKGKESDRIKGQVFTNIIDQRLVHWMRKLGVDDIKTAESTKAALSTIKQFFGEEHLSDGVIDRSDYQAWHLDHKEELKIQAWWAERLFHEVPVDVSMGYSYLEELSKRLEIEYTRFLYGLGGHVIFTPDELLTIQHHVLSRNQSMSKEQLKNQSERMKRFLTLVSKEPSGAMTMADYRQKHRRAFKISLDLSLDLLRIMEEMDGDDRVAKKIWLAKELGISLNKLNQVLHGKGYFTKPEVSIIKKYLKGKENVSEH